MCPAGLIWGYLSAVAQQWGLGRLLPPPALTRLGQELGGLDPPDLPSGEIPLHAAKTPPWLFNLTYPPRCGDKGRAPPRPAPPAGQRGPGCAPVRAAPATACF